mgnify:CR=1 FL=1
MKKLSLISLCIPFLFLLTACVYVDEPDYKTEYNAQLLAFKEAYLQTVKITSDIDIIYHYSTSDGMKYDYAINAVEMTDSTKNYYYLDMSIDKTEYLRVVGIVKDYEWYFYRLSGLEIIQESSDITDFFEEAEDVESDNMTIEIIPILSFVPEYASYTKEDNYYLLEFYLVDLKKYDYDFLTYYGLHDIYIMSANSDLVRLRCAFSDDLDGIDFQIETDLYLEYYDVLYEESFILPNDYFFPDDLYLPEGILPANGGVYTVRCWQEYRETISLTSNVDALLFNHDINHFVSDLSSDTSTYSPDTTNTHTIVDDRLTYYKYELDFGLYEINLTQALDNLDFFVLFDDQMNVIDLNGLFAIDLPGVYYLGLSGNSSTIQLSINKIESEIPDIVESGMISGDLSQGEKEYFTVMEEAESGVLVLTLSDQTIGQLGISSHGVEETINPGDEIMLVCAEGGRIVFGITALTDARYSVTWQYYSIQYRNNFLDDMQFLTVGDVNYVAVYGMSTQYFAFELDTHCFWRIKITDYQSERSTNYYLFDENGDRIDSLHDTTTIMLRNGIYYLEIVNSSPDVKLYTILIYEE